MYIVSKKNKKKQSQIIQKNSQLCVSLSDFCLNFLLNCVFLYIEFIQSTWPNKCFEVSGFENISHVEGLPIPTVSSFAALHFSSCHAKSLADFFAQWKVLSILICYSNLLIPPCHDIDNFIKKILVPGKFCLG